MFFIAIRFNWLGPHLTQQALGLKLDKWQIGPLRVINLVAFTTVVYWARKYLAKLVSIEPFLTLGKASLKVFCAHLFFVFAGLALLYGDINQNGLDQLHGLPAIALLAITFTALIIVAANEVKKKHAERDRKKREAAAGWKSAARSQFCARRRAGERNRGNVHRSGLPAGARHRPGEDRNISAQFHLSTRIETRGYRFVGVSASRPN